MSIILGSARIDENGNIAGGAAGDQTGHEVSTQEFYVHENGWYILRSKSDAVANGIANAMLRACENDNIGYDQNERYGVLTYGTGSTIRTECDCSSLVRQCIKEASGVDVGDFYTGNEAAVLEGSGLFSARIAYTGSETLYTGDVLVTQSTGHTVAVVSGASRGGGTDEGYSFKLSVVVGGSKGRHVLLLQRFLKVLGYYKGLLDGDAGKLTTAAIYAFQKDAGISQDGSCGLITWNALTNLAHSGWQFNIRYVYENCGNTDSTKDVQLLLKGEGYKGLDGKPLAADGICQANTVHAIRNFQRDMGLAVDGYAGAKTLQKLIGI